MHFEKLLLKFRNAQLRQFIFEEKKVGGFALSDIKIYCKAKMKTAQQCNRIESLEQTSCIWKCDVQ